MSSWLNNVKCDKLFFLLLLYFSKFYLNNIELLLSLLCLLRSLCLFYDYLQVNFLSFFQHMFSSNVNGDTRIILMEEDWLRRVLAMVGAIPEGDKAR